MQPRKSIGARLKRAEGAASLSLGLVGCLVGGLATAAPPPATATPKEEQRSRSARVAAQHEDTQTLTEVVKDETGADGGTQVGAAMEATTAHAQQAMASIAAAELALSRGDSKKARDELASARRMLEVLHSELPGSSAVLKDAQQQYQRGEGERSADTLTLARSALVADVALLPVEARHIGTREKSSSHLLRAERALAQRDAAQPR